MKDQNKKELELYIHIPFCVRKCKYCDFLSAVSTEEQRQEYVESLCRKIRSYNDLAEAYVVVSIFVGGGTPSILTEQQIQGIFESVEATFSLKQDAEITLEMNPGTVTREKLKAYMDCGINRLSIGLQSADNRELKALGRIHSYEEFLDSYEMAREVGFLNINVDLMSAIPFQTVESYRETLHKVANLDPPPEHISAYSLIIEEGTPFYEIYGDKKEKEVQNVGATSWDGDSDFGKLPGEEKERKMYRDTIEILKSYGYHRYEISNYAKEGYECLHNLGYWNRREYLGIGSGASSLIENRRFTSAYLPQGEDEADENVEVLSREAQMEETMFLGLRTMRGVSKEHFYKTYDVTLEEIYGTTIEKFLDKGLLKWETKEVKENDMNLEHFLQLTEKGIDVSNYVMSEFLFSYV